MPKHYSKVEITKLPQSEIEIKAEISASIVDSLKATTMKEMAKNINLPGFRKGNVPESVAKKHIDEMTILSGASEQAIQNAYQEIVENEKLLVLGNPQISITKLAQGNPLLFSARTAILPEVILPNYKSIAKDEMTKEEKKVEVTEKEVDDVILEIRKKKTHDQIHGEKVSHDSHAPIEERDLPELTDEFAKSLGEFSSVADLKTKIKENIKKERERQAEDKKRAAIFESIIEKTKCDVPKILIENEQGKLILQLKENLQKAGIPYDEYLKQIKKSEEEIKNELKDDAEKKAKFQLILNEIAQKEKIEADGDKVRAETEKVLILYPDSDPARARAYIAMMLTNQKVVEFLENQK